MHVVHVNFLGMKCSMPTSVTDNYPGQDILIILSDLRDCKQVGYLLSASMGQELSPVIKAASFCEILWNLKLWVWLASCTSPLTCLTGPGKVMQWTVLVFKEVPLCEPLWGLTDLKINYFHLLFLYRIDRYPQQVINHSIKSIAWV